MKVEGKWCRALWTGEDDPQRVFVIDQRLLPHRFETVEMDSVDRTITIIQDMYVRGAPLIGATGAYGVCLAVKTRPNGADPDEWLKNEATRVREARPTAVNLAWAVDLMLEKLLPVKDPDERLAAAFALAGKIADQEVDNCKKIGQAGLPLIEEIHKKKGGVVNVLTHCNAGWLACVDYGTATAPIYAAFEAGIPVHVWVDETRPLNQGARLTAWELLQHGVPHTVVPDNSGGHLMQHNMVDLVIVGTDRTTVTGDVANKIGTYLKALAAKDNGVPFYVALPSSTIDWDMEDGVKEIPIEERDPDEIRFVYGLDGDRTTSVLVPPEKSPARNDAFDVTPRRLVTGLITERGVCAADKEAVLDLFPEKKKA